MAQKTEKEETELKVPETLALCTPPIPTQPKQPGIVDLRSNLARPPERSDLPPPPPSSRLQVKAEDCLKKRAVNRCSECQRKVGLTGFRCRCGELFCSEHRYSDRHDCSFDYKAAGREAIARENPSVRPVKILKV